MSKFDRTHLSRVAFAAMVGVEIHREIADVSYRNGPLPSYEEQSVESRIPFLRRLLRALGKSEDMCNMIEGVRSFAEIPGMPAAVMRMGPEQIDAIGRREFSDPVEWSYYALAGWFPSILPGLPKMSASDNRALNLGQVRPLMNMMRQFLNFTERVPRSKAENVLGERLCAKVFQVPEDYSDLSGGIVCIGGPARDLSPIAATATEMIMHFRKELLDHPLPE